MNGRFLSASLTPLPKSANVIRASFFLFDFDRLSAAGELIDGIVKRFSNVQLSAVQIGRGQGAICLNTQNIACILVYVSFLDILDNKKFKTCWYTCHLRSPTFMDLNKHLFVLISSTSTIFQKVVLVVLVVLLSTWLCAEFSHI